MSFEHLLAASGLHKLCDGSSGGGQGAMRTEKQRDESGLLTFSSPSTHRLRVDEGCKVLGSRMY